ncbi:unnamed protein product [Closterium sp. Naga37s-1]|nr:unnamed protein product [Closterium sp. Naga37s-1]
MDRFGHNKTAIVLVASAAHVSLDPACDESTMFGFRVQQLTSTKIVHLAGVVSTYNLPWFNGVVEILQQMITKFTKGGSGFMQAPDYAACDTRILAIIGRGAAVADNSAEDLTVPLIMPPGPRLHDPRSRRRVVRAVTQTYIRTAAEMGIPPRDFPERTGLSNDDVINRPRRTPIKRARLGSKRPAMAGCSGSDGLDGDMQRGGQAAGARCSLETQGGSDVHTQGHVSNTVKPNTPDATPVKGRRAGRRMQKTSATLVKASGAGGVGKRGGTNEYTGVWFDLRVRKWCVKIVAEPSTGKQVRLGAYMDEKDAAYAYAAGAFVIRRKDHFPKVMALTDTEMAALEGAIVDDVRHLVQKRQWYRWREWRKAMNDIGVLPGTPFKPEPGAESLPPKAEVADSETRDAEADEDLVSEEDNREQDSDGGIECTQAQ